MRLLAVGRFARAKGTDVLVEAIGRLAAMEVGPFELELVGNPAFSYPEFVARLEQRILELGIAYHVRISPDLDDDASWGRLERSHIVVSPSRHEGLCVPVVEAYLAGCRVVAADGGNLRYVVQAPDPVVPAGDAAALAEALASVTSDVRRRRPVDRTGAALVAAAYSEATAGRPSPPRCSRSSSRTVSARWRGRRWSRVSASARRSAACRWPGLR